MRFRWALVALGLVLGVGCDNPQPALLAAEPAQAYSDHDLRLLLLGRNFIPATLLDPQSGRRIATSDGFAAHIGTSGRWTELPALDWLATGALAVSLPSATAQRLPEGPLDLRVTDPRGATTTLSGAFVELGRDTTLPVITFTSPDPRQPFVAGMVLRGSFHVSETQPGWLEAVSWRSYDDNSDSPRAEGTCAVTPMASEADCDFQIGISQSLGQGHTVRIVAYAIDSGLPGNEAWEFFTVTLQAQPVLFAIVPDRGGMAGGTDVVVSGSSLADGSQVVVDGQLLLPNGGVWSEGTLSGWMPAHAAGSATVSVRTPLGDAVGTRTFLYLPPPRIDAIDPDAGDSAGGTVVAITGGDFDASTRIFFGQTLDGASALVDPFLQSDGSIVGRTPPGNGVTAVWAVSDGLGFTQLPAGFTWKAP